MFWLLIGTIGIAQEANNESPPEVTAESTATTPSADSQSTESASDSVAEANTDQPAAETPAESTGMDETPAPAKEIPEQEIPEQEIPEQEIPEQEESIEDMPSDNEVIGVTLPIDHFDGRPFRPIGVYQSQLVGLVPQDFIPVALGELRQLLSQIDEQNQNKTQARLLSSFYDVRLDDQLLLSDRSVLVFDHPTGQTVRQNLGRVNLAITPRRPLSRGTAATSANTQSRFEADAQGQLIAVIPSREVANKATNNSATESTATEESSEVSSQISSRRSELQFGWTLRGENVGAVRKFDLRLPRCPQSRLVISVDSDVTLESRQGVLVERPGPPPDADVQTRSGEIRWYVLEAGGLNRIELFARKRVSEASSNALIVRRESKQYEVDLGGAKWTHHLSLEMPVRRDELRFRCPVGSVSDVRLNFLESRFQVIRRTDGQAVISIQIPGKFPENESPPSPEGVSSGVGTDEAASELMTLTITGNSDWNLGDGMCSLPSVIPMDENVYWSPTTTTARVTITGPLEVAKWNLPIGWQQSVQQVVNQNQTILTGEGPSTSPVPASEASTDSQAWSSIGLIRKTNRTSDHIWTRMRVSEQPVQAIKATTRIHYRLLDADLSPMTFDVNQDWIIEEVRIIQSGRRINVGPKSRVFSIWPTPSEASLAELDIEITSRRNLLGNRENLRLPASWVIRPRGAITPHVIAVQAPGRRRWNGDSVLIADRVELKSLDEQAVSFLQPTSETILLQSDSGQVPALELEPIDIAIGVSLKHVVTNEPGGVVETIVIRSATSQPIKELGVLTGTLHSLPFDWLLRRIDQSATVSLPPSDIQPPNGDPLGTYIIRLDGREFNDYELVGRRFLPSGQEQLSIQLPSVRDDTSQNAELFLSAPWEVMNVPEGVLLVPGDDLIPETDDEHEPSDLSQRVRYDPALRPELTIRRLHTDSRTCLIWKQSIEVTASGRMEDLVYLSAELSTRKPIHIIHDDDLELISINLNGKFPAIEQSVDGIWIDPELPTDRVAISMRRRHQSSGWLRQCMAPDVQIEGHVLEQQAAYEVDPTSFLLHIEHLQAQSQNGATDPESESTHSLDSRVGLWIMPRHIALGIGWLVALSLVQLSWMLCKYVPKGLNVLFVAMVLSASGAVIFWQYQLPILIWVTVPLALGGLLHVITRKPSKSDSYDDITQHGNGSFHQSRIHEGADFSLTLSIWIAVFGTIFGLMANTVSAQAIAADAAKTDFQAPIELLLPLDQTHHPTGDKVYLSKSDYERIRDRVNSELAVEAQFQAASYRVILEPSRDSSRDLTAEIQAEYQITTARESTKLLLPIRSDAIRRIELINGDESQIARYIVSNATSVIVDIPRARQFGLRVTFIPNVTIAKKSPPPGSTNTDTAASESSETSETDPEATTLNEPDGLTHTIRLPIPIVHMANLIVEAPREILIESLGTPFGKTLTRPELGRYEADLGPINELLIKCHRERRGESGRMQSLRRTYRIAAGVQSTIVECEIESITPIESGQSLSLTILGPPPTNLDPTTWKLSQRARAEGPLDEETLISSVGVYQFIKQSDAPAPVRLFWRLPSLLNDPTSTEDRKLLPVPDVVATNSAQSMQTMFGIESAPSVRLTESASSSVAVSSDDFLNRWVGYSGPLARAFVAESDFPSFALWRDRDAESSLVMQHHLHVDTNRLTLTLNAIVIDPRPVTNRISMAIPAGFQLLRQSINGEPLAISSQTKLPNGNIVVSLGDRRIDGQMEIKLVCQANLPSDGKVALPRIEALGAINPTINYQVTRSSGVRVEVGDVPQPLVLNRPVVGRQELLAGQIPVFELSPTAVSELLDSSSNTSLLPSNLRVRKQPRDASVKCNQTSLMRYVDGQWVCHTLLQLPANRIPDFVDVEIPGAWARSVIVDDADVWAVRNSNDSVVSVARIHFGESESEDRGVETRRVLVTCTLDNRDQGRVTVPKIKVLGNVDGRRVVLLPQRLTTEAIDWRRRGARETQLDPTLPILFGNILEDPTMYSAYNIVAENWSIQLEPLSQAAIDPVALCCDARLFLTGDRAIVFQRFDILPEQGTEVVLALPSSAKCIGVWAGGREIDFSPQSITPVDASAVSPSPKQNLVIPLAYSRLPQSLEVFLEITATEKETRDYLCAPVGIPLRRQWLSVYQAPSAHSTHVLTLQADESRGFDPIGTDPNEMAIAFAQSVVLAIERSRDLLAERSDAEISQWLLPWVARYESIATLAGHRFDSNLQSDKPKADTADKTSTPEESESESATDEASIPVESVPTVTPERVDPRWTELDRRLLTFAGRFLTPETELPKPLLSPIRFRDYERLETRRLKSLDDLPVLKQRFAKHDGLQRGLFNIITLITFALAIILLWPFRGRYRYWLEHPTTWLVAIALLGCFFVPFPVPVAILLVAVSAPALRYFSKRPRIASPSKAMSRDHSRG
ncbi:hypothetical protein LOC67_19850 [Stieleria sp. JC731]|uniref:hypothetical protein n=1 Tax=Pirellulaceae TaxID=2691357 RepID=UPI001E3F80B2|nr:hypothetical protein [Stieleria sp. JC731]MCC9602811.1 hypothetical protein [Stieleria sp. JC731]